MLMLLDRQREAFRREGPPALSVRQNRIDRLLALLRDNTDAFTEAMNSDFGTRSRSASPFTEVVGVIPMIEHTRSHVAQWMKATTLLRAARVVGLTAAVEPTPLGVVGIVGPWNFPVNLVVLPAAAALAAGNRVMIKMSKITPRAAALMKDFAPQYFNPADLAVITGGRDTAATFTGLPFDHLFFTGSPEVGKLVQRAAAANLVPVTLELGGKNPVVVGRDADIPTAAARIAIARMVDGGQVCVCPDYVFVPQDRVEEFLAAARRELTARFGSIVGNPDYCSCVNEANFDREEIFGPVLMVMTYTDPRQVVDYVNDRPAPLVAYWYGPDGSDFRQFVRSTRSGGVARNESAAQMIPSAAPFGGVGRSGMGAYHGKAGFDAFSHYRTVVGSDLPFSITDTAAPPFRKPMKMYADVQLRLARRRTHRRLEGKSGVNS